MLFENFNLKSLRKYMKACYVLDNPYPLIFAFFSCPESSLPILRGVCLTANLEFEHKE